MIKILGKNLNSFLTATIFFVLSVTIIGPFSKEPSRDLASSNKILLEDWDYKTNEGSSWKKFNYKDPSSHADEIEGNYYLRHRFNYNLSLEHPAIVLGIIPKSHKVYLNEKFIGGSEYYSYVAHYAFDKSILKEENELIVQAYSDTVKRPGIQPIHYMGSFLGDFREVHINALSDILFFHSSRLIYLFFAFILACMVLTNYSFNTKRKEFLYFSLYLFLGTTALLYYNFFVVNTFSFEYHRFIKAFSIMTSSFILYSAYLTLNRRKEAIVLNNLVAFAFITTLTIALLSKNLPVSKYLSIYEVFFKIVTFYTLAWITYSLIDFTIYIKRLFSKKLPPKDPVDPYTNYYFLCSYKATVIISGVLTLIMAYSSGFTKTVMGTNLSYIGITYPFVFSFLLACIITIEKIYNGRSIRFEKKRGELTANIAMLLNNTDDFEKNITLVQDMLCSFLKAERSTIYVADDDKIFKAMHVYGQQKNVQFVQKVLNLDEGIISHVYKNNEAVLIKDLRKEFSHNPKVKTNNYKTSSCMIFPLFFKKNITGFITFADKINGKSFNEREFSIIKNASNALAILVISSKWSIKIVEQVNGVIETLSNMIDQKDEYTKFHSSGVTFITRKLSEAYGIPFTRDLKIASLLHDVGKIFVPKNILEKACKLNKEEKSIIEKHPKWSEQILSQIPGFENIAKLAAMHHETIDGKGYPYQLTEDLIPVEAQIIGVADFIDALSTNRAYRERFAFSELEKMLDEMVENNKFSKKIVDAAKIVIKDKEFRIKYSEKGYDFKPEISRNSSILLSYTKSIEKITNRWGELAEFLRHEPSKIDQNQIKRCIIEFSEIEKKVRDITASLKEIRESNTKKIA